ncbi:MAG: 5'-deoxynucleotidase [Oscillospiraceae bacterium]|nr:5'-deoxynucleotidase [Oscillospiraceae bacterium]
MSHFFAMIFRMRNIRRWGLMRSVQPENLAEHALLTALLAQGLAVIRRDVFGGDAEPDRVAARALLHDACEIVTGDMPTPVKYHNPELREAYARVEEHALGRLLGLLPAAMRGSYREVMDTRALPPGDAELIHAADKIAAHIKCVEELSAGNREFSAAHSQTLKKLRGMKLREADYFIEHFLPAFDMTLDEAVAGDLLKP